MKAHFTLLLLAPVIALAEDASIPTRLFLMYSDSRMVNWMRASGNDPGAVMGGEIPTNVPLLVPHAGMGDGGFSVGVGFQLTDNRLSQRLYAVADTNLAFDRAYTSTFEEGTVLDEFSFRKLTWGAERTIDCYSFPSNPIFHSSGTAVDLDGDGQQDWGTWRTENGSFGDPFLGGAYDPGHLYSVRSVGFASGMVGNWNTLFGNAYFRTDYM